MRLTCGTGSWPRRFQPRQSSNRSIQGTLYAPPNSTIPGTLATGISACLSSNICFVVFLFAGQAIYLNIMWLFYLLFIYLFNVLFVFYLFIRCCVMLFFTVRITVVFYCRVSVECSIPSGTTLETSGISLTCYPWVVLSA